MNDSNTIKIGLSMAGAISAGAYTAGVVDYLLEALESWQRAKELQLPDVPQHNVCIEVISGASAGGMTAVIAAAATQLNFPHINQKNYADNSIAQKNPLYNAWVNQTAESDGGMMLKMLETDDILKSPDSNPNKEVRSLLNAMFIEEIACKTIDSIVADPNTKREYLAKDMELFTTITNLRGFDYELLFVTAQGKKEDRMTMHKDIVHFQLNPLGEYKNDGRIPYNFDTPDGLNKELLIDAAIATGAFPVGLAPRVVVRDAKYINDNPLLKITHGKDYIVNPLTDYNTVCVDGGVINNEPYDLTEQILAEREKRRKGLNNEAHFKLEKSAEGFDTTILTIDPFPNFEDKPASNYFDLLALKYVVPSLITSMRQQLMLKTDLLQKAYDPNDYSRFMVVPIRSHNGVTQEYSIACGSVGGFGGFFSKKFRVHDFMLGRRNCQRFIQQYFYVPDNAKNPIVEFGYSTIKDSFNAVIQSNGVKGWPIIPDIRVSEDEKSVYYPADEGEFAYPDIDLNFLLSLEGKMKDRLNVVLNNITNGKDPGEVIKPKDSIVEKVRRKSWFYRTFIAPIVTRLVKCYLNIGKMGARHVAASGFIDAVIADMHERGLIKDK